jgi:hypothetical protein
MEIGEPISFAKQLQKEGKCVVCKTKHKDPKKENIEATAPKDGWRRDESMVGVFECADANRASIYPSDSFPPPYKTEGHHCVAHICFIEKGKDLRPHLDHFLNKVGFAPNQPRNIIHLPGRYGLPAPAPGKRWPAEAPESYKNFWLSVDIGKPLQLHIGNHSKMYFACSFALMKAIVEAVFDPAVCEESTQEEFERELKTTIDGAVNYAFKQVAEGNWVCHPEQLRIATDLYGKVGKHQHAMCVGGKRFRKDLLVGYGGECSAPVLWPKVNLETEPF